MAPAALVVETFAVDIVCSPKSYGRSVMKRRFVVGAAAAAVATTPDKFVGFV